MLVSTTQFQVKAREIKSLTIKNRHHIDLETNHCNAFEGIIHKDWDITLPNSGGWLYLSKDRVWMEDPGIRVTEVKNIHKDGVKMTGKRTACPPEENIDYPGHDLKSLTSSYLDKCVEMCRSRDTCRGVTWTRDTCQMKSRMLGSVRRDKSVGVWSVRLSCGHLDIWGVLAGISGLVNTVCLLYTVGRF